MNSSEIKPVWLPGSGPIRARFAAAADVAAALLPAVER